MPSTLVRGGYVVSTTARGDVSVIENGAVVQRDGRIIDVGEYTDVRRRNSVDEELGSPEHLVLPGFVNAHHHFGVTPLQLGQLDVPPELWTVERWSVRDVDPYLDALFGAVMMIESGITTVLHNHSAYRIRSGGGMFEEACRVIGAYEEAGMRVAFAPPIRDKNFSAYDDDGFLSGLPSGLAERVRRRLTGMTMSHDEYFDFCGGLFEHYGRNQHEMVRIVVSPSNVQWCSDSLLERIRAFAFTHGIGVHLHLQETLLQKEYGLRTFGKTPVAHLADIGFLGPNVTCAHVVWATNRDLDVLGERGAMIATQASADLRLQNGIAPVVGMLDRGLTVGVGVSEAGLNDDRDIIQEMRLISKLHRVPGVGGRTLNSGQVLHMGTLSGAKIAQFPNQIGSIEKGRRADLVLMSLDRVREPYLDGRVSIVDALLYRGKAIDVDSVMINGRVVLRDRKFTHLNRQEIVDEVRRSLSRQLTAREEEGAQLGAELRPYVERFYQAWTPVVQRPHCAYNSSG
jgi:cytosine/adenosine deaminase-related metal-dependent hydrolase